MSFCVRGLLVLFGGLFVDLFLLREESGRLVAVSFTSVGFALAALFFCVREFLVLFGGLSVDLFFLREDSTRLVSVSFTSLFFVVIVLSLGLC
jgi:hypothetical protein